ncbi:hypothetical protein C7459_12410 [Tumebacillus permanentifrigoris]|uniref:Uncharacterized protein n=1 Tax=Tumebacillus permanentifrigoris TaxID=378543 RepID=A0A316D2V7_9BACL|nr:hypothetical protein C7459_12410 [Tumebacillus permanentifrigoris]
MWFFFFKDDSGKEHALGRLINALRKRESELQANVQPTTWDVRIANELARRVDWSCEPKKEIKRDGTYRKHSRQCGIVKFHGRRFKVVGYYLYMRMRDHDWYQVLLRFEDGIFQTCSVNLYHRRDVDRESNVAFYGAYYSDVIESRYHFIHEDVRREYRRLPTIN